MPLKEINQIRTISRTVNRSNGELPFVIYEFNSNLGIGSSYINNRYTIAAFNAYIKDLRVFAKIESLNPVEMPEFNFDDSETTKLYKALDVEWQSPRKQFDLLIQPFNSPFWLPVGSISLLNPSGYPYRVYDLMELYTRDSTLELGIGTKIGGKIKNVGYGLLEMTDELTIYGSCTEEITLDYIDQDLSKLVFPTPITNVYFQGNGTQADGNANSKTSDVGNNNFIANDFLVGN